LPILLVTSYYLFDRCKSLPSMSHGVLEEDILILCLSADLERIVALGKQPKSLEKYRVDKP
jgi:hypothetical protein